MSIRNLSALIFILTVFVGFIAYKLNSLLGPPSLPKLEETWWGPGDPLKTSDDIRPFKINVSDTDLKDLQWRLENHRPLVPPLEDTQQQYGINTKLLKSVIDFWKTKYNWRERELYLNKFPQFKTNIQGLDIHYIHVKPTNIEKKKILPLLILHGWPGSVREFYEMIPMLTSPNESRQFAFEVIVPSIPGFGFSQAAVRPGLGAAQMALVFKNLMNRLGFDQYYTQGGDLGAYILQCMAVLYPDSVLGFHSNMCLVYTPKAYLRTLFGVFFPSWVVRPDHYDRVYPLKQKAEKRVLETGYLHLQATKPDTLGVAMTDSPIGLAAYILEKFTTGTDYSWQLCEDGGLLEQFTYSDLLDNVMIYWITGSATTSFRLYSETFNRNQWGLGILRNPVAVPSACTRFRNELYTADGLLAEIYPNLLKIFDHEVGGHFAAFQLPAVLARDIFDAVKNFQEYNKNNQ